MDVDKGRLVATPLRQGLRPVASRVPVPKLEYIVVTTHPVLAIKSTTVTANEWVRVMSLKQLVTTGIINATDEEAISKAQSAV